MNEKILIIGGVAAGATAAAKARRISSNAQITMLEAGVDISFANCGLPYYIGGDIKNRSSLILQSPESFNEQYNVNVHTNTVATSINRGTKQVVAVDTRNGEAKTFNYDKPILAQEENPSSQKLQVLIQIMYFRYGHLMTWIRLNAISTRKSQKKLS